MEKINPAHLLPLDIFTGDFPLRVDLAYAGARSFCGVIYRKEARLWLHRDLAAVVLLAACLCEREGGFHFVAYDGLRTVSAQALMLETDVVRAHPAWTEGEDRVLSRPGQGGHPRAMAVDLGLLTPDGRLADMGTAFDEMPESGSGAEVNRAHRQFADLPESVKERRALLEGSMMRAAALLSLPLLPLPVEWWDFRFPASVSGRYAPLDEADLPRQMQMTPYHDATHPDFPRSHFARERQEMMRRLAKIYDV